MLRFLDKLLKKPENIVRTPIDGISCTLNKAKDPLFADGTMGSGCFITPNVGKVYAPVSGTITMAFPTKHAYGIKTKNNIELMIHIGVDTVELNGQYFKSYVQTNQKVLEGELIAEFDKEALEKRGIVTDVFLIVTDKEHSNFDIFYGEVNTGDLLFTFPEDK